MGLQGTQETMHQLGALGRNAMERAGEKKDGSVTNAEETG